MKVVRVLAFIRYCDFFTAAQMPEPAPPNILNLDHGTNHKLGRNRIKTIREGSQWSLLYKSTGSVELNFDKMLVLIEASRPQQTW